MIEHHQGYTALKRYGRNSFRPVGKHAFKLICNARAVKYDLIQQSKKQLMHASKPSFRQTTGCDEITNKGK